MAIRTVLVSVSGAEDSKVLLHSAFHLAKDLDTHLQVLHVRTDPRETIPLLGEGMSVGMIDDMTRIAEEECDSCQARARFSGTRRKFRRFGSLPKLALPHPDSRMCNP